MNYLQLCQLVSDESGTGQFPGTVSGLLGRPAKIAHWVQQAWVEIQNDRDDWFWMEDQFTGSLLSSVSSYEGSDFSLTRFGAWKPGNDPETGAGNFTVQGAAESRGKEGEIRFVKWSAFWRTYDRGANAEATGRPSIYSVDTQDRLKIWPIPDGAYTLRGVYRKSPQTLSSGTDVPELPTQYHKIIVWRALISLGAHDEAFDQVPAWNSQYADILGDLQRTRLPKITLGAPLA